MQTRKMNGKDKKKFIDNVLSGNRSKYMNLLPEKLYKFISLGNDADLDEKKLATFSAGMLYLSSPSNFNDPYDCRLNMKFATPKEIGELVASFLSKEEQLLPDDIINRLCEQMANNIDAYLNKVWKKLREQLLVCCFTEQWNNFVMWAHYANCYQGFCVEYNVSDFISENSKSCEICPVIYSNNLISFKKYFPLEEINKEQKYDYAGFNVGSYAVLSKHLSWQYENEWRLVQLRDEAVPDRNKYQAPVPTAIYFGNRISEKNKRYILDAAEKFKIKNLYDVDIDEDKYELVGKPISVG